MAAQLNIKLLRQLNILHPRQRLKRNGQALVEFAFIAPVLVFILVLCLVGVQLFMASIQLRNADREAALGAAEYLAENGQASPPGQIQHAVANLLQNEGYTVDNAGSAPGHIILKTAHLKPQYYTNPDGTQYQIISVELDMTVQTTWPYFNDVMESYTATAKVPGEVGSVLFLGATPTPPPPSTPTPTPTFTPTPTPTHTPTPTPTPRPPTPTPTNTPVVTHWDWAYNYLCNNWGYCITINNWCEWYSQGPRANTLVGPCNNGSANPNPNGACGIWTDSATPHCLPNNVWGVSWHWGGYNGTYGSYGWWG